LACLIFGKSCLGLYLFQTLAGLAWECRAENGENQKLYGIASTLDVGI